MKMFVRIPHLPLNISLRDSQSDVFRRKKQCWAACVTQNLHHLTPQGDVPLNTGKLMVRLNKCERK